MRVFVLDTYYPAFLADHYGRRPELGLRGYREQLSSLIDRCFGTSDAYSRNLRALGHDAIEVVANCEQLQLRWAREQGYSRQILRRIRAALPGRAGFLVRRAVLRRIALDQIEAFDPHVVYVQDHWFFQNRDLDELRRAGRFVAAQIASGPPAESKLRHFDLLLTSFPHFVDRFREQGLASEYLKIAFDEKVLQRLRELGVEPDPAAPREHAATFVGGLDPGVYGLGTRVLERAVDEAGLEIWGYAADTLPTSSSILSRYRGEAWGLAMYEVLAHSRIALNRHGEIANGYANNMRLYEATGVGALLVTEAARNLAELFEPGREVVVYEGEDDLVEQLRHYAAHDDQRRRIAAAGQARTFREHTYAQRMAELATMLEARVVAR